MFNYLNKIISYILLSFNLNQKKVRYTRIYLVCLALVYLKLNSLAIIR